MWKDCEHGLYMKDIEGLQDPNDKHLPGDEIYEATYLGPSNGGIAEV